MQVGRLSELGPRTIWDIVDDAFDLYRERWVLLCTTAAIVLTPLYVLEFFITAGPMAQFTRATADKASADALLTALGPIFGVLLITIPLNLFGQAIQTGITSVVVQDVLTERRITSLRQTYAIAFRRFWPLLVGALAMTLAVMVGSCALFIGALYAAIVLNFMPQAIVLEGRGVADAFRRSQTLIRSDWGRVFGQMLLVSAVTFLLSEGLTLLLDGIYALLPKSADVVARDIQKELIGQALTSVVSLFLAPLASIASTLLYYDFRVRREGFDLVTQAQAIGYPLAPDPFGDLSSEEARERLRRSQQYAAQRNYKG